MIHGNGDGEAPVAGCRRDQVFRGGGIIEGEAKADRTWLQGTGGQRQGKPGELDSRAAVQPVPEAVFQGDNHRRADGCRLGPARLLGGCARVGERGLEPQEGEVGRLRPQVAPRRRRRPETTTSVERESEELKVKSAAGGALGKSSRVIVYTPESEGTSHRICP